MRSSPRMLAVITAYVVATVVMTWPFVNWDALGSALYPGDARLMAWTLAWNQHALLNGLPLFDANVYHPATGALAYTDPLVGIAVLMLPLYALTGNAILTHNVATLLAFVLNGLAVHVLVFRLTRRHAAAFVGGLTYAFSFYMMLHAHGHVSLIWAWLLPLSLVCLDRWVERPTWPRVLLWSGVLLLQMLASWYLAIIALVATAIVFVWHHAVSARGAWWRRMSHLAAVTAACAAVIVPLALPYRQSLSAPLAGEVRGFSADLASYLVPPLNTFVGQWWLTHVDRQPRSIWGELTMFLGWIAVALAVAGLVVAVMRRQWRIAGPYVLLVVVGGALSFGPAPAAEWPRAFDLFSTLPGVSGFRVPARFGLLVLLGVAVLASLAVAEAYRRFGHRAHVVLGLVVPLMLAEWFVVGFPLGPPRPFVVPPIYSHPAIGSARAIVSLPDYRYTEQWFAGADYLLYSTTHWRPIVNGYGRSEPPEYFSINSHVRAFPGPNNARTMRRIGVDAVVFHADRYGPGAADVVATALETGEYELVAQDGSDYLFRVKPKPASEER